MPHALMAQLPITHCNDILKSKGVDINLATYLKHTVATSVSHCTLNYMDIFLILYVDGYSFHKVKLCWIHLVKIV